MLLRPQGLFGGMELGFLKAPRPALREVKAAPALAEPVQTLAAHSSGQSNGEEM